MDVPTITMDRAEAARRCEHYRKALSRRADSEYETALIACEKLSTGTSLIDLDQVFAAAPVDEKGRPKLALARADRLQVRVTGTNYRGSGARSIEFRTFSSRWWRGAPPNSVGLVHAFTLPDARNISTGYALVPMIPPEIHPGSAKLRRRFILWEVEQWADERIQMEPDYDPLLLSHLVGSLYAIEAQWDLTELERAIMTGRRDP